MLNPELRTEQQEGIISGLVNIPSSYDKIAENNYQIYQKLTKGINYFQVNSQSYKKIYLLDQS
ncbi:MAG: hypothetical protein NY202_01165 [Mollicutes bacterium UO1]